MSERTGTQILESLEQLAQQAVHKIQPAAPRIFGSEDQKELYKALHAAQKEFRKIEKSGFINGRNIPYAKINDLIDASMSALFDQHLVANTRMESDGLTTLLITRLYHFPSGQYIESSLPLLNGTDEQKRGSSITYAWRYTYAPLLGLVDTSYDDGGEEAVKPPIRVTASK